ncbi:MAG: hypothetical protein GY711_02315 [bacterium]|nr:hypothetical protein [bacterium]
MKHIQVHPLSVLLGATATVGVALLTSMQTTTPFFLSQGNLDVLDHMSVVFLDDGQGGTVKTIRFSDVNVQIVNGVDMTDSANGLGNLIVGYNELGGVADDRTGSHNVVCGTRLQYTDYGGQVIGIGSRILAPYASVSGGTDNVASALGAAVSGGVENTASGNYDSVSGGEQNTANGFATAIAGGRGNQTSNNYSTVGGGTTNQAMGRFSTVSAGSGNMATEIAAAVSGGENNQATEVGAAVSGGRNNTANGQYCSVSGGEGNTAGRGSFGMGSVNSASVSGGMNNIASGFAASVSGGTGNEAGRAVDFADPSFAWIGGGANNGAVGDRSAIAGGSDGVASGDTSAISGGSDNTAANLEATVSGGCGVTTTAACQHLP